MGEMIEKVAQALYESDAFYYVAEQEGESKPPWAEIHPLNREDMLALARDAIEPLRKPTEKMRIAALTPGLPEIGDPPLYEMVWQAMLDAALAKREA